MTTFFFIFNYNNDLKEFTCQEEDIIEEPFKNFAESENKQIEDFAFYYKTMLIKDYNKNLNETIFGNSDKNKFMIFPNLLKIDEPKKDKSEVKNEIIIIDKMEDQKEEVLDHYYDIICPECKTSAIIDIGNDTRGYDLKISNCENFHNLNKINYDIYDQFNIFNLNDKSEKHIEELIPYSDFLVCGVCNNNRIYMTPPEDKLFFCFPCGINICSECMITHDNSHKDKIFPLEDKNYYCIKHGKIFTSYCIDCNCNICEECRSSHPENEEKNKHELYDFNKIMPSEDDIEELSRKVETHKEQFKNFISSTKELFNKMITTVESYINSYILIESTLIKRFKEDKKRNFQLIRNLGNENIFDNALFKDLENPPNKDKDPKDPNNPFKKIKFLNTLYSQINNIKKKEEIKGQAANSKNKIVIKYEIKNPNKNNRKVRILDEIFVKNNKDRLSVFINGKKSKEGLKAYYNNTKDKREFTVILTEKEKAVVDMSYMLNNCKNLKSVDFKEWDTTNIASMEAMLQLTPLKEIPKEFSKFVAPKLKNIRALFCKCVNITEIPDLTNIFNKNDNINNITNISMIFNGCKNLLSINGNYWYGNKIQDMSYAFNSCEKLESINLGYITTNNVINMCGLFNGCKSLTKIPSVITSSKMQNVEDISIMFQDCAELESVDVSNFNTMKVKNMNGIFSGCSKLKKKVNLKNWSTDNVQGMVGMFKNCNALTEVTLPGKMNLGKVKNASWMFYGCENLKTINSIDNLKFSNKDVKVENFFDKCQQLDKKEKYYLNGLVAKSKLKNK